MDTMQAIVLEGFGEVDQFRQTTLPRPVPKDHELLIQIRAAAFNPIDYQMRQGRRESAHMHSPVLGRELAGTVVETGRHTTGFLPGDAVIAAAGSKGSNGTYAEYIALDYRMVAHMPAGISFETAAAVPTAGLTAWQAFSRMNVQPGESVFITGGAGGVGSVLIKLLRAHGTSFIMSTAGNEHSVAALIAAGLSPREIISYKQEQLEEKIMAIRGQQPFDWAVDIAGGSISATAAAVLGVNKGYADITFLSTPRTRELLFDKGCFILNISNYAYAADNRLGWYGQTLQHMTSLLQAGVITPPAVHITGKLSAAAVRQAHMMMEANQTNGRKLVMYMDQ
ncbi:quinone oxidoreductase family protein [Chitinophaga solisilvae]|uniref:quinone oxidoreductase family protein n=1 Tax=Chitinophaga solisilvae TaxID=1233460 RepID=UPI00136B90C0|nr:NADP-dependent oxidoreductase [Chitinophaga solisilvae]